MKAGYSWAISLLGYTINVKNMHPHRDSNLVPCIGHCSRIQTGGIIGPLFLLELIKLKIKMIKIEL